MFHTAYIYIGIKAIQITNGHSVPIADCLFTVQPLLGRASHAFFSGNEEWATLSGLVSTWPRSYAEQPWCGDFRCCIPYPLTTHSQPYQPIEAIDRWEITFIGYSDYIRRKGLRVCWSRKQLLWRLYAVMDIHLSTKPCARQEPNRISLQDATPYLFLIFYCTLNVCAERSF